MKDLIQQWEAFLRLERLTSASDLFKARTVYVTALLFLVTQIANGLQMYIAYEGWILDHTLLVVAMIVIGVSALSLRIFANFDALSVVWGSVILIAVGGTAIPADVGINSALLPVLVAGVVLVAILGSKRSLLLFCLSAILMVFSLNLNSSTVDLSVLSDPDYVALRNGQRTMQTLIAIVLVGAVMALLALNLNQLFEKLERNLTKSRAAEAARMQFLADMSHELRTPLNGVLGMNQLLLRTDLDETQESYARIIAESGSGMIAVIDDILDLTRLEAAKVSLMPTDFDPARMLDSVIALYQAGACAKGVGLHLNIEPGLPSLFKGDHGRLRQIMGNLINNAVKFTDNGHITISLRGQDMGTGLWWLNFFVEDTGVGIPQDRQAGIFDRYEQAQDGQKNILRGSGLGLAICHELVQLMQGEITVVSEPGIGSRFCVAVPLPVVEMDRQTLFRPSPNAPPRASDIPIIN